MKFWSRVHSDEGELRILQSPPIFDFDRVRPFTTFIGHYRSNLAPLALIVRLFMIISGDKLKHNEKDNNDAMQRAPHADRRPDTAHGGTDARPLCVGAP